MPKPTYAQEQYADGLVERLRMEQVFGAEGFARRVLRCQDRTEMSCLISDMYALLDKLDKADRQAGLR